MHYGRRSSVDSEKPCINSGCTTHRVQRIDHIEKYDIPVEHQPTGQSAYHCIHCDWVWFATWNSEGWSHINVEGIWKGEGLKPINSPDIAHRPPKPQKKATPDRSLKGPRNKKGSK